MGIFTLIVIVPIVIICALLGIVCLKLVKLPTSLLSVSIFTSAGGVVGVITIIVFGVMFSNSDGQLDSSVKILGMFIKPVSFLLWQGFMLHRNMQNIKLRSMIAFGYTAKSAAPQ